MAMINTQIPLLTVGMGYVFSISPNISINAINHLESSMFQFIVGNMTLNDCKSVFNDILGTSKPLNKISSILSTLNKPIPDNIQIPELKGCRWMEYEDERILAGIHRYGLGQWEMIAKFVGNKRTSIQCKQRWCRALNPGVKKSPWSREEEEKLVQVIHAFPNRSWNFIASRMGNRSDVQCRYHYKQLAIQNKKAGAGSDESYSIKEATSTEKKIELPPISSLNEIGLLSV